jgi:hypothetical protein
MVDAIILYFVCGKYVVAILRAGFFFLRMAGWLAAAIIVKV